jgi:methylenetetrahydrofolate dehydrogenase (NADP+)/methenyltetrahydrofolate cyclohydrolase
VRATAAETLAIMGEMSYASRISERLTDGHRDVRAAAARALGRLSAKEYAHQVMRLLEETNEAIEGKEAVVVGHSEIVGRPVSMLLLDKLATTTVCHVGTDRAGRLEEHVRRADVLIVAVGRPQVIKGAWIKPGATVVDVGINMVNGRVVGDVEFDAAAKRAAFISPVPGGVGPVTVMMVMKNTVEAFKLQAGNRAKV